MAAQHLPRNLARPSSESEELAQTKEEEADMVKSFENMQALCYSVHVHETYVLCKKCFTDQYILSTHPAYF